MEQNRTLHYQLKDAIAWLEYALDDFVCGKTQSVSGNENANRLAKAMSILVHLERDLSDLEGLVTGSKNAVD